ncbi:MAG: TadE/TadG family type IV pilus assembly protein [Bacteroidota bacterium]
MMNRRSSKAQAMVEFALALPIFLLVLYGLIEAGRLVFLYATVGSSSREAVRYASAWGDNAAGDPQYLDCPGIRDTAKRVAFLLGLQNKDIAVAYYDGASGSAIGTCPNSGLASVTQTVKTGDRVAVTVSYSYSPIIAGFTALSNKPIASTTARTIMGRLDLNKP